MRIVFFGSSDFAVESLKALLELSSLHQVLAVFTQPDREKGRHLHLAQTPVKQFIQNKDLDIFQPEDISQPDWVHKLKSFQSDIFVVVSFGQKLSPEILDIPRYFCLNVHASILPRWRGASPINRAITSGDKITGVTIMRMNEKMDCGDIILTREIEITSDDDAVVLGNKLAVLGASALTFTLEKIENNDIDFIKQNEQQATIAKKLKKEEGLIDWTKKAEIIYNQVRGLRPWPCAFTHYKDKNLKIIKVKLLTEEISGQEKYSAGVIIAIEKGKGIIVKTGQWNLLIELLQPENKKVMPAYDFVIGHGVSVGNKFL